MAEQIRKNLKFYQDFPKRGINFVDISPILLNPDAFKLTIDEFVNRIKKLCPGVTEICGMDARGFYFGPSVAMALGVPFVPIRKLGKLPGECFTCSYTIEYGNGDFQIQKGVLNSSSVVVLLDDVLATGGALTSGAKLVEMATGKLPSLSVVLIELQNVPGRVSLPTPLESILLV